jgi:three-Cys-motif partner protein
MRVPPTDDHVHTTACIRKGDSVPQGGPRSTKWRAEPHTLAKHRILRNYLNAWIPTLAQSFAGRGRVVIIDGFAGPGEYEDGEEGSPIIAIKAVRDHQAYDRFKGEFVFVFVEKDPERHRHLEEVAIPALGALPANLKVTTRCGSFDGSMAELLDSIDAAGSSLAPSFTFIDPFGFSDTPMSIVGRLLAQPRAEVLVTFMVENINRFLEHPNDAVLRHYDALFGHAGWRDLRDHPHRLNALGDFYKQQLIARGAKYVWSFRMLDDGNRAIYDLFFATKNIEGLKKMKRAMWGVDPVGGFRFSDRAANEQNLVLFGPHADITPLRRMLLEHFAGRTVRIEEIEEWILVETPYHDGHIRQRTLDPLDREEITAFIPPPARTRRGHYPPRSRIKFP